jgi:hypothetical protein
MKETRSRKRNVDWGTAERKTVTERASMAKCPLERTVKSGPLEMVVLFQVTMCEL